MSMLLTDDPTELRRALCHLLQGKGWLWAAEEADTAATLLRRAQAHSSDLILLGWQVPPTMAIELQAALQEISPDLFVTITSSWRETDPSAPPALPENPLQR